MDLLNDGNGWEWRVDMRKQGEGPANREFDSLFLRRVVEAFPNVMFRNHRHVADSDMHRSRL